MTEQSETVSCALPAAGGLMRRCTAFRAEHMHAAYRFSWLLILTTFPFSPQQDKPAHATMPESPTTARPLEMDDDEGQESGVVNEPQGAAGNAPKEGEGKEGKEGGSDTPAGDAAPTASSPNADTGEAPPPKPPRPLTEAQKNELTLKEAFPSVEIGVIKAVLRASRGQVEPAFHALLGS